MCGFLGCVHKNTFEFSEDSFLRSLHEINHRGPDNTGFIQVEDGKNLLKLGHKRLTILDSQLFLFYLIFYLMTP